MAVAALAAGIGGYALGASSGEDVDAAVGVAREKGASDGALAGERKGRAIGERQEKKSYKMSYDQAFNRAYKSTLEGDGQ